ncbi:23822_t:CDS:2 [Cetraspora pellucida]|uniref:23822_t:CDS:1 n=1 Tax=Cetraspora pellucida TaxID=1433469 RepID=A0A9N8W7Q0_9GLOM|nr:23822_t:CDS:2 [Cetraspora pellucida]
MTHKSYNSEICQKTEYKIKKLVIEKKRKLNQKENEKLEALKQILVMMHKLYDPEICQKTECKIKKLVIEREKTRKKIENQKLNNTLKQHSEEYKDDQDYALSNLEIMIIKYYLSI